MEAIRSDTISKAKNCLKCVLRHRSQITPLAMLLCSQPHRILVREACELNLRFKRGGYHMRLALPCLYPVVDIMPVSRG